MLTYKRNLIDANSTFTWCRARHWWAMIGDPGRVGYRVFRGIGGGLGLLLKYSVCPVGAPRELRIDLSAVQQKL
ncbi:hypothetical protein HanHA300_Chr14g0541211 [Helianthus annuus]|nr:hypothetical protein HanHA300_Chr14g0541211 [Helianthus annuus]KAJ0487308.1 hypothetical protein HanHA89_Chr14g0588961 [Helianthus annuus]